MIVKTEEVLEKTDLRTLWSDTLFEMLFDGLENEWSTNAMRQILKELKAKGLKTEKILKAVEKRYGKASAHEFYKKFKKRIWSN